MIKLLEPSDVEWLFNKLDEINERTKKHTIDIKALEKKVKSL